MNKHSNKYFLSHAETETQLVDLLFSKLGKRYQHVLCIPAFDEAFSSLKHFFESELDSEKLLLILIVNEPLVDSKNLPIAQKHISDLHQSSQNTQQLITDIRQHFPTIAQQAILSLHSVKPTLELLLIQRVGQEAIPYHQGVGLARKIANDCAAKLIHDKLIDSPILFNTDADACLPSQYFNQIQYKNSTAAWLYPFEHEASAAAQQYQKSLQHYVEGLAYAGSPYAFHTIGSTFALNAKHYVHARGFPKKNAGEDFYLLNKLAKLGTIEQLKAAKITLSARHSHRVPFGTGIKVKNMEQSEQPDKQALFYHPLCFEYLRAFLLFTNSPDAMGIKPADITSFLASYPASLETELLEDLLVRFAPTATQQQGRKQFFESFDGFQHLKFIHYLRDQHFSSLSEQTLQEYLSQA